jgi:hypothetical protein
MFKRVINNDIFKYYKLTPLLKSTRLTISYNIFNTINKLHTPKSMALFTTRSSNEYMNRHVNDQYVKKAKAVIIILINFNIFSWIIEVEQLLNY